MTLFPPRCALDLRRSVAHNSVVHKAKQHNEDSKHNATITQLPARPRILFPSVPTDDFTREVLGVTHPQVREFTPSFFQFGTAEDRELKAGTSEADRATLRALAMIRSAYTADDPIAEK